MKVLAFLFALIFVVISGAWLFTSEHSPLVSALGIGVEGDFESEARSQVPSLVDMREDAYCASNNRRDRHEWEGRFQHVSVKLLRGDLEYDAQGTVSYYAINPRDGSSQDCEDTFRRKRSDSKWKLVSDPAGDERQRITLANDSKGATTENETAAKQQPPNASVPEQIDAAGENEFWQKFTGIWIVSEGDADGAMGYGLYASRDGMTEMQSWVRIGRNLSKTDLPPNGWPGAKITVTSTNSVTVDFGNKRGDYAHILANLQFRDRSISGTLTAFDKDGTELTRFTVDGSIRELQQTQDQTSADAPAPQAPPQQP